MIFNKVAECMAWAGLVFSGGRISAKGVEDGSESSTFFAIAFDINDVCMRLRDTGCYFKIFEEKQKRLF